MRLGQLGRRRPETSSPSRWMRPPVSLRRPVMTSASSAWPLPETPAIPRISPERTSRLTPRKPGRAAVAPAGYVLQLQADLAKLDLAPVGGEADLAADHPVGQVLFGGLGGGARADLAPVAQDGHTLADLHHFMQFMRNEDEGMAIPGHLAHDGEQLIHFLRGEHGGRLVEDEQGRAAIKGLDDLDALLLADRKLPDVGIGIDLQTVGFRQVRESVCATRSRSVRGRGRRAVPSATFSATVRVCTSMKC